MLHRSKFLLVALFDLVAIDVIELEKDLRVSDLEVAQAIEHFFDRLVALNVSCRDHLVVKKDFDLVKSLKMLLHNERCSHLRAILVSQMGKARRLVGVVGVIVDERFAFAEVSA